MRNHQFHFWWPSRLQLLISLSDYFCIDPLIIKVYLIIIKIINSGYSVPFLQQISFLLIFYKEYIKNIDICLYFSKDYFNDRMIDIWIMHRKDNLGWETIPLISNDPCESHIGEQFEHVLQYWSPWALGTGETRI